MMPRKKLDYYAARHGIDHFAAVKMTDEECLAVCEIVDSRPFGLKDCGGRLSTLIDCVTDDPQFRKKIKDRIGEKGENISEDFLLMRMADYAADEVMAAYASLKKTA